MISETISLHITFIELQSSKHMDKEKEPCLTISIKKKKF